MDTISLCLNDFARGPRYSREEEHELALKSRAGDAEAREQLIRSQLFWAARCALRLSRWGIPKPDLLGLAEEAVIRAVDLFDPHFGTRLTTYVAQAVYRHVERERVMRMGIVRLPSTLVTNPERYRELQRTFRTCSLSAPISSGSESTVGTLVADRRAECPDAKVLREVAAEQLRELLRFLPQREREMLLAMADGYTLEEVAACFGLTHERVRQITARAFRRLRKQARVPDNGESLGKAFGRLGYRSTQVFQEEDSDDELDDRADDRATA